jgi:lysophospholipase L1-like esterase
MIRLLILNEEQITMRLFTVDRHLRTALLGSMLLLIAVMTTAMDRRVVKDFPGQVRLTLPKAIYAVPGVETNIYFDNVVLVINPANYVFDVTCDLGSQYDDRWTYMPQAGDVGDHPITIEVRDQTNAIIGRARSTIRVTSAQAGAGRAISLLAVGDSHLQKDTYLEDVLDLAKADPNIHLTLDGSRGRGNKPSTDDLRHEGYNGWTAEAFATRVRPKPRTGYYVPAETGSPFIYVDQNGKAELDFAKYCQEFNQGKPIDVVIIQLGGNDIWRGTDHDIDAMITKVFGYYDQLIKMIHDYSKETKIGVIMLDPLSRSQHGYRNYRAERKQTRWQYRRDQHRMIEREIETFSGREAENIYLVPVHLNLDCVHGFPMQTYPLNARMPVEEQRVYDGAHMSPEGYRQFGDSIYAWLKFVVSSK